jgi:IS30 family transposase
MKKSSKLTFEERVQIRTHLEHLLRPAQIAKKLGRHRSTICRELNLWGIKDNFNAYDPGLAHFYARDGFGIIRRFECKLIKHPSLLKLVIRKLKRRWSPQQIAGFLKRTFPKNKSMQVSHESIYKYIYSVARGELKKELISYLRYSKSKRKTNVGSRKSSIRIKDRISIDYRPEEVDDRTVPGHWESDLIIGKDRKTAIGTIVERTTRFAILVPLKNRTAEEVRKAFARELKKLPKELTKTMTHDNGLEMAQHKLFTKQTNIQVYFCHPYSSWERATNENTNGLIRDFWPKGTDFDQLTRYQIKKVQKLLNERPRKVLNWFSPAEVFLDLINKVA